MKSQHENKMKDIMKKFIITFSNHDYIAPQNLDAYYTN